MNSSSGSSPSAFRIPSLRRDFSEATMTANRTATLALLLAVLVPAFARADVPTKLPEDVFAKAHAPKPEAALTKLEVSPPAISLNNARDRQSIVVQATYADGITRDVTAQATLTPANPALLRRDKSIFWPAADGKTALAVAFGGQKLDVPVEVKGAHEDPALSFRLDVMPVFMRAGCNTGSCHGAARGKDGFRISLFGFDPAGDHYRLTHEISGRRVNLAVPADSTLLEKSIGAVQHTGGKRFEKDSELYRTLHRWIEFGVPNDDVTKLPKVVAVELYPKNAVLDGEKATQQMTVLARYSDGTDRDVTGLAVFLTNNDTSAAVTPDGLVTAGARGEAFVMARFETYTVGSQFIVLPKGLHFEYPKEPEANYIDKLVAAKLQKLRIAPSGLCTDEVFVRRVFLDIVGIPPTVEEYNRFMSSTAPDKRAKLIDELLGRKEFAEIWVNKWAELLQIKSSLQISYKAMFLYYNWLVERLGKDMPMDQMVQELLGANGGTFKNPATNFYQNTTEILPLTENVAQVFMGMRIQCAAVPQPPIRPMDPGRLLRLRRLLLADRPQAGRGLPRDDRLQLRRRRDGPPRRRPGHEAQVPRRPGPRHERQGPPGHPRQVARLEGEPVVRRLVRQPRLGSLHGGWDRRARR